MSPLGMAMVAAEVDAGVGPRARAHRLRTRRPPGRRRCPPPSLGELRQLMRLAVKSGSAHAANLPGQPVYGQAGVVKTGARA